MTFLKKENETSSGGHARADALQRVIGVLAEQSLTSFQNLQSIQIEYKSRADYVSEVDREIETSAERLLRAEFGEVAIAGEEFGGTEADRYWSVDPIDGTANFLSGLPIWAVSIAEIRGGRPWLGAVALPALSLTLVGGENVPLRCSNPLYRARPSKAVSFGVGRNLVWPREDRHCLEADLEAQGYHVVCLGSCAAALAFCALGRLAGYVEHGVNIWDAAGGVALCRAADFEPVLCSSEFGGKLVQVGR